MSGSRTPNPVLAKKPSRWRFGRRRSSSSSTKMEANGSPTSPGVSPPVQPQFHRSQQMSPASPTSPTSTSPMSRVSMREREQPDEGLRQLVKSLSLKDDPAKFGAGTLAARRMQREELDAAMAQNLFSRELARVPQISPQPASPQHMPPGQARPPVQVDMRPLMHLKSAFTEREWALFTEDPLRYIQTHGLPQEVNLDDVTASTNTVTTPQQQQQQQQQPQQQQQHFILPPEFPRPPPLTDPPSDPFPQQPQPVSKGLSQDEISRLLTTFGHQKTVGRADGKNRPSRIRGRKLPKGAKTKGIISEEDANECSICLLEFEPGEKVGLLPCCHRFHADCVTGWLQRDATCPECREGLKNHLH